jgi:hypothetical protein
MLRRTIAAVLVGAIFAGGASSGQTDTGPRVRDLRVESRGRDVFVTFAVSGALNPELARKIEAGLETAIRYDIRLYRRYPYWFDDPVERRKYRVAVTFDPVTREYAVDEILDGKPLGRNTTRDFPEAVKHLLSRENLLAFHVQRGRPTRNLYVQMRASFDAGYVFTIIPVDSRTPWKKSNRFNIRAAAP